MQKHLQGLTFPSLLCRFVIIAYSTAALISRVIHVLLEPQMETTLPETYRERAIDYGTYKCTEPTAAASEAWASLNSAEYAARDDVDQEDRCMLKATTRFHEYLNDASIFLLLF